MVMKKNKVIIVLVIVAIAIIGAISLNKWKNERSLTRARNEITINEEQYRLLRESLLSREVRMMNNFERRNAWKLLNAMENAGFVENVYPRSSAAALAVEKLRLLGIDVIEEIDNVRIDGNQDSSAATLVARIRDDRNRVYYILYNQSWGLSMVIRGSEDGKIIYCNLTHFMLNGRIYERGN